MIQNLKLVDAGSPRFDLLEAALLSGPCPTRNLHDNLADIAAQVAANRQGAQDLLRLVDRYSWDVVSAYMRHIQRAAEQKMRAALARLPAGRYHFADHLDDGSPIAVTITIADINSPRALGEGQGVRATIDFTGTGPVLPGNLNANRAIVTAAVMYCLRCLIQEDIPLNQGVLAPIRLVLPECLLNPPAGPSPEQCPAVVGGNVETSQRIVDVILGALGLAAASQGTMNNLLFGNAVNRLLRDDLRRLGRHARGRRGRRRPYPHDQHPRHRPRGPRTALSGAALGILDSPRLRRRGPASRRRRRRPPHRVPRRLGSLACSPSAAAPTPPTASPAASPAPWAATSSTAPTARPRSSPPPSVSPPIPATSSPSTRPAAAASALLAEYRRKATPPVFPTPCAGR